MQKRLNLAIVAAALMCPAPLMAQLFQGCGSLVEGVECVLFQADSGGLYVINHGPAPVGTRLHVTGMVDPNCITFCQQGNGCIFNGVVVACPEEPIDVCGTLVQGVECVLFETDGGSQYILDFYGPFGVGDRVAVAGVLDPSCFSFCQQGNGCIHANVIGACPSACPCDTDGNGETDVLDLLGYLGLWFLGGPAAEFDGSPGVDSRDLLAYLGCWFPASEGSCP